MHVNVNVHTPVTQSKRSVVVYTQVFVAQKEEIYNYEFIIYYIFYIKTL
jgi:hypothetical protein